MHTMQFNTKSIQTAKEIYECYCTKCGQAEECCFCQCEEVLKVTVHHFPELCGSVEDWQHQYETE